MRSVVMIAHAFPPEGNAGAYRPFRFARHLPQLGWNPSIVTVETSRYERYDPALLAQLPPGLEVVRARGSDWWQSLQAARAGRLQRRLATASAGESERLRQALESPGRSLARRAARRAEAWFYHPDLAMPWIGPAVAATVDVVARQRSAAIWATAGPLSSLIVAGRASRATGVPYVLDFRDAWTLTFNEFEADRPAWAMRADRKALYRLMAGAQAVTFRYTTEAECYWRAYARALEPARIHIIPNGFDGPVDRSPMADGDTCRVLYAGTLSSYRYDTLLEALRQLKSGDAMRARRLAVHVVGEGSEALAAEAARLGLSDLVRCEPPTTHEAIERLQREAHALLVLGRPQSFKGHELFAGAKLFGYLKAGRPIIGVLPFDESRKILRRVGVSTIADSESVPQIAAVFRRVLDAWTDGTLRSLVPDADACSAYSALHQTTLLAAALEGRPAAQPFVPGMEDVPASLGRDIPPEPQPRLRTGNALLHS